MTAVELWKRAAEVGAPLVSPVDARGLVEVTFVWRGEAERTEVGWGERHGLRREPGTDVWHGTVRLPATLRTVYHFSHLAPGTWRPPRDDSGTGDTHIDPLNPRQVLFPGDPADPSDHNAWASLLTLPRAAPERWCLPQPGVPAGTIEPATLGERRVAVYRPAGERRAGLPAVVIFDGYLGRTMMRIPTTVDNLVAAGRIPPLVAIFVDGTDATRDDDLSPTAGRTTEFVVRELLPWARREYGISPFPRDIAAAGSSYGGLAAAVLALREPGVFGAVLSQSGSFWWPAAEPEWLLREITRQPRLDLRFYLDVGDRETFTVTPGVPDQRTVNRRLRDALRAKGYPVTYAEYAGEHDYVNWRNTFADGLIALFGTG
ncbi:esterase family protein [Actinoplanes sp. N902-109]|uniref:alpha/beta hydrolase n=1 Tax=Actinoplanes sp. (strain N902-109) TaxID=649831 RepID=UPI0003295C54|nr:alpha/beta hydrolase-fold protein [Actinoplanes sp. N902-109]AGL17953.1 putative esterase [Actinoplanes sp. N902-109]